MCLGLLMFIVCLSAWDCSFVSSAKFGTFSAFASSNMLLVPLALSFWKKCWHCNTQKLYLLLLSHWTQSLLMFAFTVCFLSISDGVNSISLSSVQLFLPCVISTLIKIPWDFYFCFICFHVYIFHLFLFYNFSFFAGHSFYFDFFFHLTQESVRLDVEAILGELL